MVYFYLLTTKSGVGLAANTVQVQSNDHACVSIYVSGLPTDIVEEDVGKKFQYTRLVLFSYRFACLFLKNVLSRPDDTVILPKMCYFLVKGKSRKLRYMLDRTGKKRGTHS